MSNREYDVDIRSICPLCGNPKPLLERSGLYDDRFGQPDEFSILVCQFCDFGFLKEQMSNGSAELLYNKYYPYEFVPDFELSWSKRDSAAARLYRWVSGNIELAHFALPRQRVLDVGCGTGDSLAIAKGRGADILGLELDSRCIQVLAKRGIPYFKGSLTDFAENTSQVFDLIIMNQVLEHIHNPTEFVRTASSLLAPSGRIAISSPHFNSLWRLCLKRQWIHWHVPYHVSFFSRHSCEVLGEKCNLRLSRNFTRSPLEWSAMNFYFRNRSVSRGHANSQWRFHFSAWQKLPMFVYRLCADAFGRGDAIIAVFTKNDLRAS